MTDKPGLTEADYLDIVERLQQAMCIEPFRPNMTDVIMLIGDWRIQHSEIERLKHYEADFKKLTIQHCGPKCACVREQREALTDSELENLQLRATLHLVANNGVKAIEAYRTIMEVLAANGNKEG